MTKKELIEELKPYSDDMEVLCLEVDGKQASDVGQVGIAFKYKDHVFLDIDDLKRHNLEGARTVILLGWKEVEK
jgi:hypothetical protein